MVYFMADSHLGSLLFENREEHTSRMCRWLQSVAHDASAIYLLGDVFDFWFEFAHSIPPGYEPLLETIRSLTSRGIEVHFFVGNHDQWTFGYLTSHTGMVVHYGAEVVEICGKRMLLAHGHGIGEKRRATRLLNSIFESRIARWCFRHLVIPRLGLKFGYHWSARNRQKHDAHYQSNTIDYYASHSTDANVFQVQWAKEYTVTHPDVKYIVMGHYHNEINMMLPTNAQLLILEAFYRNGSYATIDENGLSVYFFEG